jgi:hypothetical protein
MVAFLTIATASLFGWLVLWSLRKQTRFPHDSASRSFVVMVARQAVPEAKAAVSPLADLERLHAEGIISVSEYERKKKELGA